MKKTEKQMEIKDSQLRKKQRLNWKQ